MNRLIVAGAVVMLGIVSGCSSGYTAPAGSGEYTGGYPAVDDEQVLLGTVWNQMSLSDQTEICAAVIINGAEESAGVVITGDTVGSLTLAGTTQFLTRKCL